MLGDGEGESEASSLTEVAKWKAQVSVLQGTWDLCPCTSKDHSEAEPKLDTCRGLRACQDRMRLTLCCLIPRLGSFHFVVFLLWREEKPTLPIYGLHLTGIHYFLGVASFWKGCRI